MGKIFWVLHEVRPSNTQNPEFVKSVDFDR
jgi:hypothetical protein